MKLNKSYKTAISGGICGWRTGSVVGPSGGNARAEEAEGGGIAVQEGGTADGSDLTVAEKAAHWHVAEMFPEDFGIEVGAAVETLPAPEAGEEEGSGDVLGQSFLVALEHSVEILGGGFGVAEVEADAHPLLQVLPDGYSAAARVHADQVPDREVPHLRLLAELVHQHPDEERRAREMAVALVEGGEEFPKNLEGGLAVELVEEVSPATRDPHQLADGPAALGDDRVDGDVAAEGDAHRALGEGLLVEEQGVETGRGRAAGQAPDLGRAREGVVEPGEQDLRAAGEGIGEDHELRLVGCADPDQALPGVRRPVEVRQGTAHVKRREADVREPGGDERHRRGVLDLFPVADHTATRAPEESFRLQVTAEKPVESRVKTRKVRGHERQRQRDRTGPEFSGDTLGALEHRVPEGGLARYGRRPLHPHRPALPSLYPLRERRSLSGADTKSAAPPLARGDKQTSAVSG